MASVAERVTARALGEQPKLRVIKGGARGTLDVSLDEAPGEVSKGNQPLDLAGAAGLD